MRQNKISTGIGIVLSGGGSRAAYQVGSLGALSAFTSLSREEIHVISGTSIGAVNSLILGAGLRHPLAQSVELLEELWMRRTYRNTFSGHISKTFLRAVQVAMLRYRSPGPVATSLSIFDPTPLRNELDVAIKSLGGLTSANLPDYVKSIAVMTTMEGVERKALLLAVCKQAPSLQAMEGATFELLQLQELTAAHGFASAALPSVLPAVDLNLDTREVRLVDGGICDNIPVDPSIRLGAESIILLDSSGRRWWFDHYGEPHDTKPAWEIPAKDSSYCIMPMQMFESVNQSPFGPLLKQAVGRSSSDFIAALGPTWPIFRILKMKMGEELAYEVLSYAALHPDYIGALIELGFNETKAALEKFVENKSLFKLPFTVDINSLSA
ncbi:MAG TPA: patatin-like phospholipase family protein [Oligoflexia bacterium]|nr:patatin-like phospholipase family protein [Oligoflexia bacterium]HMP48860.1 patatin-like phospholipase family protein [Oligoflexia bacterium]